MTTTRRFWLLDDRLPRAGRPLGPSPGATGAGRLRGGRRRHQPSAGRDRPAVAAAAERRSCATAPGLAGLGSVGYGFGNGLRLEVEGNYRQDTLQHFRGTSFPTLRPAAPTTSMARWPMPCSTSISARAGCFRISALASAMAGRICRSITPARSMPSASAAPTATSPIRASSACRSRCLGWSGCRPRWNTGSTSILGPQRFTGDGIGTEGAFGPKPYGVSRGNQDITSDYSHSFLLGVRYEFNPAPPPPPPPCTRRRSRRPRRRRRPAPTWCSSTGTAPT